MCFCNTGLPLIKASNLRCYWYNGSLRYCQLFYSKEFKMRELSAALCVYPYPAYFFQQFSRVDISGTTFGMQK